MIRKLLVLILFQLFFTSAFSQNTLGTISITNDATEGYTLFTSHTETYLINNCGEVINQWSSSYLPGNAVYLLENGSLLRAGRLDDGSSNIAFGGQGGIIELYNWEGTLTWSYIYSSTDFRQHHDVYPMPNGNILILAATVISESDAIQAGRDPSLITEGAVYNEQIFEVEPIGNSGANVVWEWNAIDHVVQDFDNTKDNFGSVADSPEKIDINFLNGRDGERNWLHFNSIQYDEERDQIIISTRNLCEIWIIDHSTTTAQSASESGGIYGKGGDLLYRWGNPQAYDQGLAIDQKLFGQHYPYIIPNGYPNAGKIIVFNNGFNRMPLFSQVDILTPPTSSPGFYNYTPGAAFGPNITDFTYTDNSSTPSEFYSAIVSSAQQLPNGNILVCEGREAYFFELDSNNDKVWEYLVPVSNADGTTYTQGDLQPVNSLTFRAIKYTTDYPAFTGRDLTPNDPIEQNPNLSACQSLGLEELTYEDFDIYPNPTSGYINIRTKREIDKIEIYTVLGSKIAQSFSKAIDLSQYKSGVYFIVLFSKGNKISKKIIKS